MPGRLLPAFASCALALAAGSLPAAQANRISALAGPEVNVSNLPGPQSEPTIVVDPTNDQILLAGSNSFAEGTMRAYSSTDGGVTWRATTAYPPPPRRELTCAGDPGVGIDSTGKEYFSFVRSTPCSTGRPRLYVIARAGSAALWGKPSLVAPLRGARFDDKPTLAVDASRASKYRNRVYVAWSRVSRNGVFSILLSHSDNGGRSWSRPVKVNRTGREESYASIAVSRTGVVYVAWDDISGNSIKVAGSTDGGAHFGAEQRVAVYHVVPIPHCRSGFVIPAQGNTCVRPNPIVSVDTSRGRYAGRVYVTYADGGFNKMRNGFSGRQTVYLVVFNSRLRPLLGYPVTNEGLPVDLPEGPDHPDQFWPASAVDAATGRLWVCFYDTRGDPQRQSAFYSCTFSADGGKTFARHVHAASVASDETQHGADGREYGDYQGLAVANGVAHPIWTDSRDLPALGEEIYTTSLYEADLRPPAPSG